MCKVYRTERPPDHTEDKGQGFIEVQTLRLSLRDESSPAKRKLGFYRIVSWGRECGRRAVTGKGTAANKLL